MLEQTEFERLEVIEEALNSFIPSDHQKLYTTTKWVPRKYLPDTDRCAIVCNFEKCHFRYYVKRVAENNEIDSKYKITIEKKYKGCHIHEIN